MSASDLGSAVRSSAANLAAYAGSITQDLLTSAALEEKREKLKNAVPPPHWEVEHYSVNGVEIPKYIAKVEDPIVELHFCTGWKSTPLAYIPEFETLNEHGISITASKLHDHKRNTGFTNFDLLSTRHFFCDPTIHLKNPDVPKIAIAHSAASGYLIRHTANRLALRGLSRNFNALIHLTPFTDVAGASKRFHPVLHRKFVEHAERYPDRLTSEDPSGMVYSAWKRAWGEPQICSAHEGPTYGQILELCKSGDYSIDAHKKLPWNPAIKQNFILASHDTASCPKTGKFAADLTGSDHIMLNAYHNPPLESHKNLMRLIECVKTLKDQPKADLLNITKPKPALLEEAQKTFIFFSVNPLAANLN